MSTNNVHGRTVCILPSGGGRRVWKTNPEAGYDQYDDYLAPGEKVLALVQYTVNGMHWLLCLSRLGIGWIGSELNAAGWSYLD